MTWLQAVVVVYGIVNIALGFVGYQAGSQVSLYAGGGAGLLCIAAAALAGSFPKVGYSIVALISLALLARFGQQLLSEFKLIPHLVVVVASVAVLGCLAFSQYWKDKTPGSAEPPPAESNQPQ